MSRSSSGNFAGKETDFNPEGARNFCVLLDDEIAHVMTEDGWNCQVARAS
jgi:hypothetical protein